MFNGESWQKCWLSFYPTIMNSEKNQYRMEAASNGATVGGYAAVFNQITDLGRMYERIEPGAFDEADMSDVRLLINHEGLALARTKSGTLGVMVDSRGLRYVATLPETEQGHALATSARRGDVSQSSFAFTIGKQRFEQHEGKPLRIIERINKVLDVSAVVYPAYEGTEFGAR
jgi:HK97 family phage prohead protease